MSTVVLDFSILLDMYTVHVSLQRVQLVQGLLSCTSENIRQVCDLLRVPDSISTIMYKNTDENVYTHFTYMYYYYALENTPERIQKDSSDVGRLCKQEHVSGLCSAAS